MGFGSSIKGLTGGRNPAALGRRVKRVGAFADIKEATTVDLFRISGGEVMLTQFYGKVTTAITDALTLHPQFTPTDGDVTDMSAVCASLADDFEDTIYYITGVENVALASTGVGIIGCVGYGSFFTNFQILVEGIIRLDVTAEATAGVIDWTLHYIPLDPNAVVNAI